MTPEDAKELLDVFRNGGFDAEPYDREALLRAFLKTIERRSREDSWGIAGTATALSPTQNFARQSDLRLI